MRWKYVLIVVFAIGAALFFIKPLRFLTAKKENDFSAPASLSLITEPDDGVAPVLGMITGARRSLDLVMYELDDLRVESALAQDAAQGVTVRVILSGGYKGATSTVPATVNAGAYEYLSTHGVAVRWSPSYFSLTHEKSLVVDGDRGLIMTFNLVAHYYATGRDFGVVENDSRDVAAMEDTFNDDWNGSNVSDSARSSLGGNDGDAGNDLVWSPGSAQVLIELINSAQKSLSIYNEEMADADVTKALIEAARRGVAVYVVMTGAEEWKWQFSELATAGVHVRTYADADNALLYIHAKVIVADQGSADARAFVGSENFSEVSLDENRELGIVTGDRAIIAGLMRIFAGDWHGAAPFKL